MAINALQQNPFADALPRQPGRPPEHGFYSERITPEELAVREAWERSLIADLGGPAAVTTTQQTLVTTAGMLEMRRARVDRAMREGLGGPAQEHVLALVNSLRLILCALGLERKAKPAPSLQDYLKSKAEAKEGGQQ